MNRKRDLDPPSWFKAWFAFCLVLGLGMLGLVAWAVIVLVTWVTSR